MRPLGTVLMIGGLVLGVGVGVAIIAGPQFFSLPWMISVGLAKLTLLASGGSWALVRSVIDSPHAKHESGCNNRPKRSSAGIS